MNRAFSAWERSLADKPRALPWAGMNDAVGVSNRPACRIVPFRDSNPDLWWDWSLGEAGESK